MGTNLDDGSGIYSTKLRKIDIASVFLDDCLIDKGRKKEKKEKRMSPCPPSSVQEIKIFPLCNLVWKREFKKRK